MNSPPLACCRAAAAAEPFGVRCSVRPELFICVLDSFDPFTLLCVPVLQFRLILASPSPHCTALHLAFLLVLPEWPFNYTGIWQVFAYRMPLVHFLVFMVHNKALWSMEYEPCCCYLSDGSRKWFLIIVNYGCSSCCCFRTLLF